MFTEDTYKSSHAFFSLLPESKVTSWFRRLLALLSLTLAPHQCCSRSCPDGFLNLLDLVCGTRRCKSVSAGNH